MACWRGVCDWGVEDEEEREEGKTDGVVVEEEVEVVVGATG